ncbi:PROTEIN SHORTAGE IN CHIASMATA 1 [Salix koriyanagi]|uniref:PROTEIN SHORTAGE IN CHIASMATA 1 n=1 Tax=Salix koriyanagi TaxID=2511006 RepID=A0A9Q1AAY8_9ROSI|nr:PROTEIN SHORTAGE IN CHIASMATA 1 [Salix koriyanagi]
MRTRFLNTDYFSSSLIETLSFLNLPVPHLAPLPPEHDLLSFLRFFDPLETLSLPIERPPIDSALSKFISAVLPHFIDSDFLDSIPDRFHQKEEEIQRGFGTDSAQEKDNGNDKHPERLEVIQFEAPELCTFLENVCFSEEGMQLLSEVSEIENDLDLLRPEIEMQDPDKVQQSVYSVEDATLEFDMDEKACALEYDGSVQEQAHFQNNKFPLLEVEETSLRTFTNPSMEYEFLLFLEHVKSKWGQENILHTDGKELLGSMQFDILEFLSKHCLEKQCLEPEMASLDTSPGMDIIRMVEIPQTREDSADFPSSMNPVIFQEFNFLETDSSRLHEVFFELQSTDEPQTCDSMFREDMNFKNFDELIVSCELTLEDDTFKSLPIPILSDHGKIRSIYAIMEEKLAELKPQLLSASHGIYLDWHLLEEDKYNSKNSSMYQNMLEELDTHNIDFDRESFDGGKLVIDLVFTDNGLSGAQMKEHKELLNVISETSNSRLEGSSSESLYRCQKTGNRETIIGENGRKASLLFKSMSQFNDLDYFLNPGKATAREKNESTVKIPDIRASFPKVSKSHPVLGMNENINDQKLEELLSFAPIEDKFNMTCSEAADKAEACSIPLQAPYAMKTEKPQGDMMCFPDIVIIVNTQNFDKEMIVSRRSTYQRILAMEKEGAQVVERDLNLPVDLIISPSICLVWYNCGNIGKKATAADEASSCLPLCIENIAANVLALLSFSFSGCILVFEGETRFLSTVIEFSDVLYAAAASLGIDLQLFSSYSAELTDEIIVSSILYATKSSRGRYPKMPESETLAESFLTKFPSINPLTAHAILSSEGMLIEFLKWSHEHRIQAVQQYHVPVESVALFSALCKYGEQEDSKSIMTDCSSSASSCPDSDKLLHIDSERKRRKCIDSLQKTDMHVDDMWKSESLNEFTDGMLDPGAFKQYDCWMLTDPEIVGDLKPPSSSLKDLFGQKQVPDIAPVMDFPTSTEPLYSGNFKDLLIRDDIRQPRLPLNDKFLGQNRASEINTKELKLDSGNSCKSNSKNLHEYFRGEVIDLTDDPFLLEKDAASIANSTYFSPWMPEIEQDSARKSKAARRLSFGKNSHPNNLTAAERNSSSDLWTPVENGRQRLPQNRGDPNMDDKHETVPVKPRKNLLEEAFTPRAAGKPTRFPFEEEISHCGGSGTPLSKAIHSAHTQQGSPWTIEFLNRVREKSRLRQQSLPPDTCTPDFWNSGNTSKATERRSLSILDFFKYQGGSTPKKVHEQKKQKQPIQMSSSSQKERNSASLIPTWTPRDKRSKQTLSFAMGDGGNQTRLVWSDGSAHRMSKKLRRN